MKRLPTKRIPTQTGLTWMIFIQKMRNKGI